MALYNGRMQTLKRHLPLNLSIYALYLLVVVLRPRGLFGSL